MFTILLAEDDIDDQELLADAFAQINPSISLIPFSNSKKILDHLSRLPDHQLPDMIILDYNLPEISGADILRKLREDTRYGSITKLVWSTSNATRYETTCLELGARAYLVKPSNITSIQALAGTMLSYLGSGAGKTGLEQHQ